MGSEESGYLVLAGKVSGVFPGKELTIRERTTQAHYVGIEDLQNPIGQGNRLFVFMSNPGDNPDPNQADLSFRAGTLEKNRNRVNVGKPGDHVAARMICCQKKSSLPGKNSLVFVRRSQSDKANVVEQKETCRPQDPTKCCEGYSKP